MKVRSSLITLSGLMRRAANPFRLPRDKGPCCVEPVDCYFEEDPGEEVEIGRLT